MAYRPQVLQIANGGTGISSAGAANNVLTSNGTSFSSAAPPGGLLTISGTLTSAQIKSLHGTPVQILAAPGAGKVYVISSYQTKFNYGGTNVFVAGASQDIEVYYGTATTFSVAVTNGVLVGTTTTFKIPAPITLSVANNLVDNLALNFYNPIATEISGNAAGDNTMTWRIVYMIVSI
jgi:hypothetical protein